MSEALASGAAGSERVKAPPPRGWRIAAAAVPVLGVAACVMFGFFVPVSNSHESRVSAECHYLPVSWSFALLGYGCGVAAVAAVVLHLVLRAVAGSRGWNPHAVWQGTAADIAGILTWLTVLVSVAAALNVHDAQADYAAHHAETFCEGLASPGR